MAGYDWNEQWKGINWASVTTPLQNALGKVKTKKIKDPFAGLVFGDLARALTSEGLYSENDLRNKGLDIRKSILATIEPEQTRLEDIFVGRGMVDSGMMGKAIGNLYATKENAIKSRLAEMFTQAQAENEEYRQRQLANALNELMNYWLLKKQKRKTLQGLSDALTQLRNQAQANNLQDVFGLGLSLASLFGG